MDISYEATYHECTSAEMQLAAGEVHTAWICKLQRLTIVCCTAKLVHLRVAVSGWLKPKQQALFAYFGPLNSVQFNILGDI